MRGLERAWLGRVPYRVALEAQRERRRAVGAGEAPEAIWALEHPPVYTLGKRVFAAEIDREGAAADGIEVVETDRGGLATYHGPGQLIVYLILNLKARQIGVAAMVQGIESALIDYLATHGVRAGRREGAHGVWVGNDKIAAIGLHIDRGLSMHGLALNLDPDLSAYRRIVACGIRDGGLTSVAKLCGAAPQPAGAAAGMISALVFSLGLLDAPGGDR